VHGRTVLVSVELEQAGLEVGDDALGVQHGDESLELVLRDEAVLVLVEDIEAELVHLQLAEEPEHAHRVDKLREVQTT
jgi:hypothetical protein